MGSFKSAATKQINLLRETSRTPVWQRNYYVREASPKEIHIVRNEASLQRLRQYIHNNPLTWQDDQLHPDVPSTW